MMSDIPSPKHVYYIANGKVETCTYMTYMWSTMMLSPPMIPDPTKIIKIIDGFNPINGGSPSLPIIEESPVRVQDYWLTEEELIADMLNGKRDIL